MVSTTWREILGPRPSAAGNRVRVEEIAATLLEQGTGTAPHVIAELLRLLGGDEEALSAVASALSPSQRRGHRMLPHLLPVVGPIETAFAGMSWTDDERAIVLLAALCTDARVEVLLEAAQQTPEMLTASALAPHLTLSHGRFEFTDPRLPIWSRATATTAEHRRAHQQLVRVHLRHGDRVRADWHHARGALRIAPEVVPRLVRVAREINEAGFPHPAFLLAVEAAEHASGAALDEARLVAGAAAMSAGCVEDAADWLSRVFPDGAEEHRAQALASLLVAEAQLRGVVPVLDPAEHRPRSDDVSRWRAWGRTAALAALMCAERGEISAMRAWLSEARDADARSAAGGAIRIPTVALCWLLSGEVERSEGGLPGRISGGLVESLRAALDGDIDRGLQILADSDLELSTEIDALIAGFEHSPVVDAYGAVMEVLLHVWRGDFRTAHDRLLAASVDLPVVIPFAGLGVVLARRIEISRYGAQGPLSRALTQALPTAQRIDRLADRALESHLAGAVEDAATSARLWQERGAPGPPLGIPELDEVGPVMTERRVEAPELERARVLRRRIRLLPEASWQREYPEIADAARALTSAFDRGRVEAMLGTGCAIRGDRAAGRRHLRAARSLFADAGADAWHDLIDRRLARIDEQMSDAGRITTMPIAIISDADPLAACRIAWEVLLTERELEVAMRVVDGAANREIAVALDVSVRTVEVHVGRVLNKLGVRSRVELTVLAHRTSRHM